MIKIEYGLTTFNVFLQEMAATLGTEVIENTLHIPHSVGEGYLRVVEMPEGQEAMVYNFRLNYDLLLERKKDTQEIYSFCHDEITDVQGFTMQIEGDELQVECKERSAMYVTGMPYGISYFLKKGSEAKGTRVLLSSEWMKKYLHLDKDSDVMTKYIEMKTAGVLFKKVDMESKEILKEIFLAKYAAATPLFYQTRLLKSVEKFFNWLSNEMTTIPDSLDISRADVERIIKVENMLVGNIMKPPPTIAEMSKVVAISESKLKKLFKQVYGLPPYEYYQKQRLDKARLMLLSGGYSIKDVGYAIGYTNMSNFTLAFKKEFNTLPSALLN
jgi:AraC-like DNA-binding protein